jgi:beta-galactosidase GanA
MICRSSCVFVFCCVLSKTENQSAVPVTFQNIFYSLPSHNIYPNNHPTNIFRQGTRQAGGMLAKYFVVQLSLLAVAFGLDVSFDNRAFTIDGNRTLIMGGSIHYPRMNSAEWPHILQSAKQNGMNLIQTYVFWDIHEPTEGSFYFPSDGSSADLNQFIRECANQGLYVNLRFGPYVCAEWNYGGFPAWLREIEDVQFRTMNDPFLERVTRFVDKTLEVVSQGGLLASDGGPIIMVQIENEYGNMEHYDPKHGAEYVQWNAEYALNKNLSIPWMMCQV